MIEYIEGNIFNSPAQTIVNTVNTVGVMGKGLALSFKKRYPHMFEAYRKSCEKHQLTIGKLMLYYAPDHWILMFPTKENWRNPSKIEYLESGLRKFVNTYADKGITSIAFPKLGCGNGELLWDDVRLVMEKHLKPLPITVYIYVGDYKTATPEHRVQEETMEWLRQNARDMSFGGLCDDLKHGASLLPYQFVFDRLKYTVEWNDGIVMTDESAHKYYINENDLFCLWDELRCQGIIKLNKASDVSRLFYALLFQKGYLSTIKVLDGQSGNMIEGYQVNEGYARLFAVRGEA